MDIQNSGDTTKEALPDFSTLSDIMNYFHQVSFETFKAKLNEWFIKELINNRPDLKTTNGEIDLQPDFLNLIEGILIEADEKEQSRLN